MRKFVLMMLLSLSIIVIGCSSNDEAEQESSGNHIQSVNDGSMGDLRQKTADKEILPAFLDKHDENMQILYTAVAEHQELLEHMPCYCGCGESVGHGHNYHCFVNETGDDGSIVWDDHATRCQVCLDIAAKSIIEYSEGKSINDIRQDIDEQYNDDGFPESTETPTYTS